jgi:L-seryl-tRNA(Ser) seleniumtransferase
MVQSTARSKRTPVPSDRRRSLPSVDALLRSEAGRRATARFGRPLLKASLTESLQAARAAAARGREPPEADAILANAVERTAREWAGVSEALNATGVLLHTGLGRAPLAGAAVRAVSRVAAGYSDLEVDRSTGSRGRRTARAERMVCALTGAPDAICVNNNAAGLLLSLAALATRREVLVSRGELIEIGGEFRLPEIMAASGAKLVEVGTTNRTRATDYRRAVTAKTGLILKVHPSNYRVVGFTNTVAPQELSKITAAAGIPLVFDVGSGLLERYPGVPRDEPSVREALREGADLVCFSGDKLLGGPQAGIVAGRADLVATLRRHPIARAVRLDKMTLAALEATLRLYASGRRDEIPLWSALGASVRALRTRAAALAERLPGAFVERGDGAFGGGALPGHPVASVLVVVPTERPEETAASLRTGRPAVFCRTGDGVVAFDLRTVAPGDDARLARAVEHALGAR